MPDLIFMGRPIRIKYSGALYYLTSRGAKLKLINELDSHFKA